jgi:hypothetical protein
MQEVALASGIWHKKILKHTDNGAAMQNRNSASLQEAIDKKLKSIKVTGTSSTCETGYEALTEAGKAGIRFSRMLKGLYLNRRDLRAQLYCDNQGTLALVGNLAHHQISKHIDIECHNITEIVDNGRTTIECIRKMNKQQICLQSHPRTSSISTTASSFISSNKMLLYAR